MLAGCGSSGSGLKGPKIAAAKSFALAGFQPAQTVKPGVPTHVSFHVEQPSGGPLTKYKKGAGPHTGVHLILVRNDLSAIIHRHPPIAADGTITDTVTFPSPGPWHVLVDVYPDLGANFQRNFQLTTAVRVAGAYKPQPVPAFTPDVTVGGDHFSMTLPRKVPSLKPVFFDVAVKDAAGRPATFTPWYGALAHAIFFREGTLDYFHSHVCGPALPQCTSNLGAASAVKGTSKAPGKLHIGVLLPTSGTWRMFVQAKVNGKIVTAPYTLKVS
ncbi:MAG: hypothetical protein JWM71_2277 [Solirubrobacteraceae bacterium]|nr:hypothetical protein [Solirubrobacteraceae bacterium]